MIKPGALGDLSCLKGAQSRERGAGRAHGQSIELRRRLEPERRERCASWGRAKRERRLAETSRARERERDARDEKRDDVVGARESSSSSSSG